MGMMAEPEPEHVWLQRMIGEWKYEFEASMKPDDPPLKFAGTESVRPIGKLWILAEQRGIAPDGTPATSFITLGYEPEKKSFVGTWVGSMMTNLWVYNGALDESGNVLKLDTVGPDWGTEGATANYQETVEWKSDDLRTFSSAMQQPDGSWKTLMSMTFHRVKP